MSFCKRAKHGLGFSVEIRDNAIYSARACEQDASEITRRHDRRLPVAYLDIQLEPYSRRPELAAGPSTRKALAKFRALLQANKVHDEDEDEPQYEFKAAFLPRLNGEAGSPEPEYGRET